MSTCPICTKTVYPTEAIKAVHSYHKACFKCCVCARALTLANFLASKEGRLFCAQHKDGQQAPPPSQEPGAAAVAIELLEDMSFSKDKKTLSITITPSQLHDALAELAPLEDRHLYEVHHLKVHLVGDRRTGLDIRHDKLHAFGHVKVDYQPIEEIHAQMGLFFELSAMLGVEIASRTILSVTLQDRDVAVNVDNEVVEPVFKLAQHEIQETIGSHLRPLLQQTIEKLVPRGDLKALAETKLAGQAIKAFGVSSPSSDAALKAIHALLAGCDINVHVGDRVGLRIEFRLSTPFPFI